MSLDKYVSRSINTVQGFLCALDAQIIKTLVSYQQKSNITGHLCEVGVHHGQLFLMLALARRPGERALAIDLFEDDSINAHTRHAGRDRALSENARRLGIELSDDEIFKTSSLEIEPADILGRTTGPVRFFSVDGGHLYKHVENDLRLAERTLSSEGVIAVDDFFNMRWADVTFATHDFLRQTKSVVPFALTSAKIYLAPTAAAERYKTILRTRTDIANISNVQILGSEALALRQGAVKRGYEALRGSVARCAY